MKIDTILPAINTRPAVCDKHGEYESRRMFGERFSGCAMCAQESRDAQKLREAAEQKAREEAGRGQRIRMLLSESGIVGRQLRSTFDSYEARDAKQRAILADCQAYMALFIKGVPPPTTSLWLLGLPGTGKSHLGAAMVNHIITNSAVPARMHSGQEIVRMLRATWNRDKPPTTDSWEDENGYHNGRVITEDELIHDIAHCKLLVLDEVGVGHGSNAEAVQLFEVLDLRYKLEKPTVLLSNLAPTALKVALGERVYDRLREGATVKACDWKSYRGEFPRREVQE
jgi:DNA replication protein DnaC